VRPAIEYEVLPGCRLLEGDGLAELADDGRGNAGDGTQRVDAQRGEGADLKCSRDG
jgi:hypothetical protein